MIFVALLHVVLIARIILQHRELVRWTDLGHYIQGYFWENNISNFSVSAILHPACCSPSFWFIPVCAQRGRLSTVGLLIQDPGSEEGHLMLLLFLVRYCIGQGSIAGKSKQVYGFVNNVCFYQLYFYFFFLIKHST